MEKLFLALLVVVSLASCSSGAEGGSEFGNPSRSVIGTVVSSDSQSLSFLSQVTRVIIRNAHAQEGCPADGVIATDSKAQTTTAEIGDDCSFDLELTTGKAYSVSFTEGDTFVATLIVNNSPGTLSSSVFIVSEGEGDIDLGNVTIIDNEAFPESEPSEQNDQDDDGLSDFDDEDDNEDGEDDEEEEDCDLDDYEDDYDEEDPCEEEDDQTNGGVLEVSPYDGEEFAALDQEIEVRFDCEIDEETVSDDTFRVESDEDVGTCEFSFSEASTIVECEHDEQDFLPSMTYTATLEGILCIDGTEVAFESWSWTTEEEVEDEEE